MKSLHHLSKHFLVAALLMGFVAVFVMESCRQTAKTEEALELAPLSIIPQPNQLSPKEGAFSFNAQTRIGVADGRLMEVARFFAAALQPATGWQLTPEITPANADVGVLFQRIDTFSSEEAYSLLISPQKVVINAKGAAGAFYAVQSLMQLMPPQIRSTKALPAAQWPIPCAEINDSPRFVYRGMHLDVGRHFFPVDFIKKYIDLLAAYKMNTFHWHLTEDQGWRIEIKKYPKLQEVAAWRKETLIGHYNDTPQRFDGQKYGGYYTQEEVRDVVAYAQQRFITIIPEIEMPGHAQAALAAYPELSCTGQPIETATKWGVLEDVYCPKPETFLFLENVLAEVISLFPSKYIHIGGDECPKSRWKTCAHCQALIKKEGLKDEHGLQSYFIKKIETYLNNYGKRIIGWDEILEGGLAPDATVMSWRGVEGGIAAARQGHDVIMTPTDFCYLDYYQSDNPKEPLAIGGFLPLEKVYSFEPVPEALNAAEARHILGAQGNVWTEYLKDPRSVEYMVLPRMIALSEVNWTSPRHKNFDDFGRRLQFHFKHWDVWGLNYANKAADVKPAIAAGEGNGVAVALNTLSKEVSVHYSLDGNEPRVSDKKYESPLVLQGAGIIRAQAFSADGKAAGYAAEVKYDMHLAAGKKITLTEAPATKYSGAGPGSILNGVKGNTERYGDAEWLGFEGKNLEAIIDMGQSTDMKEVQLTFFNGPGQWIYLPRQAQIFVSEDGKTYREVGKIADIGGQDKVITVSTRLNNAKGRYLKVGVQRYGLIPDGAQGAGHEAWLFVDEIVVK